MNQAQIHLNNSIIFKKSILWAFLLFFFYKITLDFSYYYVISKVWEYSRFDLNLNILKFIESFFLLIVIFVLMPKSKEKLSNIMVWLLILLSYVPMLTLFAFMDQPRSYMYAVAGFWLLVFLWHNSYMTELFTPECKIFFENFYTLIAKKNA